MREHGKRARYVHGPDVHDRPKSETGKGCRCKPCCIANRAYANHNNRQRVYGRRPFVDAGDVVAHVRELQKLGVGYKTVAARAGVSKSSLLKLLTGERTRCRPDMVVKILDVPIDAALVADGQYVDAAFTWHLIGQLLEMGWTKVGIAEVLGQSRALQLGREQVTAAHARAVRALWRATKGGHVKPQGRRSRWSRTREDVAA